MKTFYECTQFMEQAEALLTSVLDDLTVDFFTSAEPMDISLHRMLEIAPIIYSDPHTFLQLVLFEELWAAHPEILRGNAKWSDFCTHHACQVVEAVSEKCTWNEFDKLVTAFPVSV